jgi:sodium/potassium/calcium exchanger 6
MLDMFQRVNNIPLVFIVVSLSIIMAMAVLLTSTFHYPPAYHWVFGYLGFAVSVIWIYALANAVVDLLQTIGILFGLSDVILGLTVLAWGNSIGGIVLIMFDTNRLRVSQIELKANTIYVYQH